MSSDGEETPKESPEEEKNGGKIKSPFYSMEANKAAPAAKPAWMQKLASSRGIGATKGPAYKGKGEEQDSPKPEPSTGDWGKDPLEGLESKTEEATEGGPKNDEQTALPNSSEHSTRSSQSLLSSKIHALNLLKEKTPWTDSSPKTAATPSDASKDLLGSISDDDEVFEDDDDDDVVEEVVSDDDYEVESSSQSEEEIALEDEPVKPAPAPALALAPAPAPASSVKPAQAPPPVAAPYKSTPAQTSPKPSSSSPVQSLNLPKAPPSRAPPSPLNDEEHSTFTPVVTDSFAPPRPARTPRAPEPSEVRRPPPGPKALPKQPSMALSTLPKPPSRMDINEVEEEEDDDWMVPHRNDDDSSWVNPSHPIEPERKQHLTEELSKKSVDLFPEDGKTTQRLANLKSIAEDSKLNDDLEYDAKVGLVVGHLGGRGDGQSISETSFSVEESKAADRSVRIMESSVPTREHADVWALPPSQEERYRAVGKLDTHKDGKDYRFSYIAQQHTHSTSSYADVVRERYFPKEDNDYWAAPAKDSTPELPIHISRSGEIKQGPSDDNESWMIPEKSSAEIASVEKKKYYAKYYAPVIAEEKDSQSVVTDGSDWMGRNIDGKSARIDFAGAVNEEGSQNSFQWNPDTESTSPPAEEKLKSIPQKTSTRPQKTSSRLPEPPSDSDSSDDDEFTPNPVVATPRPPSPPASHQQRSIGSSPPQEAAINSYEYSPSGRKKKISYSPSGRLKFDDSPKTILVDDNDDERKARGMGGPERPDRQKQILCCLSLCFFLVLVPAAIACIIVFVVDPNNKRGNDDPSNVVPSPTIAPNGPTQAPSPTLFPPPSPGAPSPTPPIEEDVLFEFLAALSTDDGEALRDPKSPQHAAMQWLKSSANQGIYDDAVFIQRFALATLYYSTGGDQWKSSSEWLTDSPECEWYTSSTLVTICDEEGSLFELNLSGNNLVGSIPPELNLISNMCEYIFDALASKETIFGQYTHDNPFFLFQYPSNSTATR
jgi:hypothetical protein